MSDTELEGFRDHAEQIRRRAYGTVGYRLSDGTTLRFDLGFTASNERLPGALTRARARPRSPPRNPTSVAFREARNYDYTRGAFTVRTPLTESQTLEWGTQLNYQDLDHPLSFAVIDDTTYSWSSELRWILAAPLAGHANRLTVGLQYAGTRQNDAQFVNNLGNRGAQTGDRINAASNYAVYAEEQFDVVPALTLVAGARGQYAVRSVRDRFGTNDTDLVDFLSLSPKAGRRMEGGAGGAGLRERLARLRAAPAAGADRARADPRQPGPARRPEGLAVRGWHERHVGAAGGVGRGRVRHRAVGRDPERERTAVRGGAVHDPALPQHRPLAPYRRRGRRRRAPSRGRGPAVRAGDRPATACGHGRPTRGRASSSWTT